MNNFYFTILYSLATFFTHGQEATEVNDQKMKTKNNLLTLSIAPMTDWSYRNLLLKEEASVNETYSHTISPTFGVAYHRYYKNRFSF